jgi:hypothetical protein
MESSDNPFLLANLLEEDDNEHKQEQQHDNESNHDLGYYSSYDYDAYSSQDNCMNSPKLININSSIFNEMTSFFKLDNLFRCIRSDEKKEPRKNISISKIIMDNIIDKKLGSTTYHYAGGKSAKAYYTYDYPEIYYNKKLYNNISQWLKEEFSKKIQ